MHVNQILNHLDNIIIVFKNCDIVVQTKVMALILLLCLVLELVTLHHLICIENKFTRAQVNVDQDNISD